MTKRTILMQGRCLLLGIILAAFGRNCADAASELVPLMPRDADHTQMWWAEGFPSHSPKAPWLRVTQTGQFAMELNTETLGIEHFGPVGSSSDDYQKLPPADLALSMTVDGKDYRCTAGGKWSRWTGPRLIESGCFFQRGDVTDLEFKADDGSRLNVEARFETAAWADRLGLILAARPGVLPIAAGEASFGRVRGGFGLDGTNHFEVAHQAELDPERFTLELWAFVPADYKASNRASPWLACKNRNEVVNGNFGIVIVNGEPQARLNIGGGAENAVTLKPAMKQEVKINAWNHLAMSYDGDLLRLYLNGAWAGEKKVGLKRVPGRDGLAIGRRQDNSGDGYHFRGVVDEIRLYDHALTLEELRQRWSKPEVATSAPEAVGEWTFSADPNASMTKPSEAWNAAAMDLKLTTPQGELRQRWGLPKGMSWPEREWQEVALAFDPIAFKACDETSEVKVSASEIATGAARPVRYDHELGWHRINLDGIEPIAPPGGKNPSNDAIERMKLVLSNPGDNEQIARLMFEKTAGGIRQRIGSAITGVSAILRDTEGHPMGIPVQLSKNWHNEPEGGVYAGQWFHGISQVRLPAKAKIELELTLAYGHWGGIAAASHAQLCLIGWGSNQLWEQSALGAWGESICYEPDQVQANCTITDVRPVMVKSGSDAKLWGWTGNVGGGDFFRCFDTSGERVPHSAMRTTHHKQGPCLTEVTYAGRIGATMTHSATVSLARTDDLVRVTYQLRLDVTAPTALSRFVIFQMGADTYSSTAERKMALGNESGLIKEWNTQWGGNTYRAAAMEATGRIPWMSLHKVVPAESEDSKTMANRGIVIRSWKARLGGKDAAPWIAERGLTRNRRDSSTLDLVPPPGVTRFEPGDFIEAAIEHIVMPQLARHYYGPNEALRTALSKDENTWRMIQREAAGNDRAIEMKTGTLVRTHPAITISAVDDKAEFTLTGGLGYVPLTFTGLTSSRGHTLLVDDEPLNQGVHGNDFWQTDYDPANQRWSQTCNVPVTDGKVHTISFTLER